MLLLCLTTIDFNLRWGVCVLEGLRGDQAPRTIQGTVCGRQPRGTVKQAALFGSYVAAHAYLIVSYHRRKWACTQSNRPESIKAPQPTRSYLEVHSARKIARESPRGGESLDIDSTV